MQPQYLSKLLAAASSNRFVAGVASTGGTLTLAQSTVDTQRRLLISSTGGSSTAVLTITGTREGGGSVVETVLGTSVGTVATATLNDFLTVASITVNASGVFTVGTSSQASTPWVLRNWNSKASPPTIAGYVTFSSTAATATATWEYIFDDPTRTYPNPVAPGATFVQSTLASTGLPILFTSTMIVGVSVPTQGVLSIPTAAHRLTITSTSASTTVYGTFIESGLG